MSYANRVPAFYRLTSTYRQKGGKYCILVLTYHMFSSHIYKREAIVVGEAIQSDEPMPKGATSPFGASRIYCGSLDALKKTGQRVLHSPRHAPILLIYHEDQVYAVDNRCPHMGFPLDRGSVSQGIITCHWHHARFCLASGGTFDPFADDLRTYRVHIVGDDIWVEPDTAHDLSAYWYRRLEDGLRHGLNLVIAKAVTALVDQGEAVGDIVRVGAQFGCTNRRTWSPGLTILTAMANLAPILPREDRILALYQGMVHVSRNTRGQTPRFSLGPLSAADDGPSTRNRHSQWFRHFVDVRDQDGAERTLLTAIAQGTSPQELTSMLLAAATDHVYLDVGHVIDFINKACELLDLIGWDAAEWVLPTLVPLLCNAQRSEELAAWRRPIDLIALLNQAKAELDVTEPKTDTNWSGVADLAAALLNDDPQQALDAVLTAYSAGAAPDQLAQALALAAAQRVLHFHTQNEFSDWDAVHHTFTYANALQRLLVRAPSIDGLRGVLHGVLRIYLDRFLNVPKARLRPVQLAAAKESLTTQAAYGDLLLALLDRAGTVDEAGALTAVAYEQTPREGMLALWSALVRAVVREDADFHTLQMVEAAWRQFSAASGDERSVPIVAAARYIAAHAPTHRQLLQTARVAMRLQAGEALHEE